ncbi:MAG TPA: hypothetical protein DEV81_03985 [Cyanobacteria bacterium UBA11049]|nr:hypothetical protein [Cyanobacteria bacterium UBA11049]
MNKTQKHLIIMKQKGDYSNNVQIGNAGSANTFNINQNQFGEKDRYIQFEDNPALGVKVYESSKVTQVALPRILSASGLFIVGLLGSLTSIFPFFGFAASWLPFGFFAIVAVVLFDKQKYVRIFLLRLLLQRDSYRASEHYIGNGEILHKDSAGNCKVYGKSAKCIYPGCGGQVYLVNPPEREKDVLEPKCVGECSQGRKHHTYKLSQIGLVVLGCLTGERRKIT